MNHQTLAGDLSSVFTLAHRILRSGQNKSFQGWRSPREGTFSVYYDVVSLVWLVSFLVPSEGLRLPR